jgi:hypothetical protein
MHTLNILATTAITAGVVSAAPVTDFRFDNNLDSEFAGASSLNAVDPNGQNGFLNAPVPTDFTADPQPAANRPVYIFDSGSNQNAGLTLPDAGGLISDDDTYTLELVFELEKVSSFRKLAGFESRSDDSGIYVNGGAVALYSDNGPGDTPLQQGGTISADGFVSVIMTISNGDAELFLDGSSVATLNAIQTGGNFALPDGQDLSFFLDDSVSTSEFTSGSVAKIALYDEALSAQEVSDLAAAPFTPIPEPASASALALLAGVALRRRRA